MRICAMVTVAILVGELLHDKSGWCGELAATVNESVSIRSEPVSLGQGDYFLEFRGTEGLYLDHESGGTTSEWKVKPQVLESEDPSKKDTWVEDGVCEIALARWSRGSLVAVVKLCKEEDATFWCLTFPQLEAHLANASDVSPVATVLSKGGRKDRVFALSGSRNPPTVTVVIGTWSRTRPGTIASGTIIIDGCANPGPIHARLGRFKPDYLPESFDRPDEVGE